ncbi:MAG: phosphate transport system protein [Pseudonocardiales bacterium]|nr:phosphate transport system regulatory protein PhoU [Pseudonocardia sp.]MDT7649583.1 phosphate transport system protein [Pseudonocardiales bacterium]
MRVRFDGELEQLGVDLTAMCRLAGDAMEQATGALVRADLAMAEQVIAGDSKLDALRALCEDRAYALLALQAPVARDLRLIVTGLQAAEKIDRMGGLACHVAEIVQRRHPRSAIPPELCGTFAEMGRLAVQAARAIEHTIANPLESQLPERERADDRTDELHRELLTTISRKDSSYRVQTGVDVALLSRFFERFADQAVAVTRRMDFVVTGTTPR